jgi:ubiquinone/menaquinone biosynthesis C-methylase UbiE
MAEHDVDRVKNAYSERSADQAGLARKYSTLNPAYLFAIHSRQRALAELLSAQGMVNLDGKRVLEIGCGVGDGLPDFLFHGLRPSQLHGSELMLNRVSVAAQKYPSLPFTCADGRRLPYRDSSFDIVCQYTVLSSILDDGIKAAIAKDMIRVTRPGGVIVWYDFWLNPVNRETKGIRKAEIRQLFPKCSIRFKRITLAPPLARLVVPVSGILAGVLENMRLLNTHYMAAIVPSKS